MTAAAPSTSRIGRRCRPRQSDLTGLSSAIEDYLRAIAELAVEQDAVTTSRVAQRLAVAEPSVTQMMKRLVGLGYVSQLPYQPIALTPAGEELGAQLRTRFQIVERFLTGALGYEAANAQREADRIEHAVSAAMAARMDAWAGS